MPMHCLACHRAGAIGGACALTERGKTLYGGGKMSLVSAFRPTLEIEHMPA